MNWLYNSFVFCIRLCLRDPHHLFQQLECQGRDYVIEMKVRLLKQLTAGHKTPSQAKQFVSMLLEEYKNLCAAASTLAKYLSELVSLSARHVFSVVD